MTSKVMAIAKKDLTVEARTKQSLGVIILFTLMVVVSVGVTLALTDAKISDGWSAVLIWLILLFAGSMALARSFSHEADRHTLEALLVCPIESSEILMGKMVSNLVFIFVVILESILLFSGFIGWGLIEHIGPVLLVSLLGGTGFAALGTTIAGIAARTKAREIAVITMMIPLALFTLIIPGILATVSILTEGVIFSNNLILIALFDIIYIVSGYALAEYLFTQ